MIARSSLRAIFATRVYLLANVTGVFSIADLFGQIRAKKKEGASARFVRGGA